MEIVTAVLMVPVRVPKSAPQKVLVMVCPLALETALAKVVSKDVGLGLAWALD